MEITLPTLPKFLNASPKSSRGFMFTSSKPFANSVTFSIGDFAPNKLPKPSSKLPIRLPPVIATRPAPIAANPAPTAIRFNPST